MTRTSTVLLEALRDSANAGVWQEFDARYRPLLLRVGRRLGLSPLDAEDAAQETIAAFLVEYRAGHYQRHSARLRDWLAGIMAHKVRDLQRRQFSGQKLLEQMARDAGTSKEADSTVQRVLEEEWKGAVLRQCLDEVRAGVSPQMYESFELLALKQWPARQVARHLGISEDLVYQNKRRVLKRVQELIPAMEEVW
jgi:RNA polymerase sigma factor (sigma-70 family)